VVHELNGRFADGDNVTCRCWISIRTTVSGW